MDMHKHCPELSSSQMRPQLELDNAIERSPSTYSKSRRRTRRNQEPLNTLKTASNTMATVTNQMMQRPLCAPSRPLLLLLLIAHLAIHQSLQQSSISLNNAQWFVSNANGSLVLPAQVPGGIYSDLRRANVLKQDILAGKNDIAYRWVGHENWTYTTSFAIDQQIAMSQSVKLLLHGVDTVSTIYLNGEEIGQTDNMFVRYKFDIKPYLKLAGLKNILVVKFESPIKYASRRFQQSLRQNRGKIIPPYCTSPAQRGECHVNFIRKMQASFSWDWGPAFPSMGLYKNIELEFGSFGIIRDLLVETRRLAPLVPAPARQPMAPPQVIISSNIKHNIRTPTVNKSVPYVRAPPYYVPFRRDSDFTEADRNHLLMESSPSMGPPQRLEIITESNQLLEDSWLLKIILVAEMVQPSFGYNVRIEFSLNDVLHYESQHFNVVANSDGFIRLNFNLRIDTSRLRIKPWWPNNAGSQTLYRLTARMLPIPSSPEQVRQYSVAAATANPADLLAHSSQQMGQDPARLAHLQARAKPLQTHAVPPMIFLATPTDMSSHLIQQVSEKEIQFGFRTVELIQEPITRGNLDDGLTFNFRINGVDLFAMGSNWIPASVLPENHNDLEHVRYLLQSAKDANMNMLRVWGGGLYESDEFYRMADEMGIMIWHDFMFACALYPIDDDYIDSVRLEIQQQVQRLQHHPSIVLWAGNNENEMAIAGPWWPEVMLWNKKLRESYHKLYVETIKPTVQALDPTRPYVVSSPSNGLVSELQPNAISRTPNEPKYGDVHHYDYLTDSFDWTVYPSTRFASEYGFQSYPSFNALTSISGSQADWKYPLTSNILHRQHRLTGETEMKLQMKVHFNELKSGGADKLKTFIYVSQLAQAIAIKTETEFYRRNRFIDAETKLGRTMGALYWQLNDVWQAPTWSSIEYGGKWKMLHYFARRFFFPIHVVPYLVQPSFAASVSNAIQQALGTVAASGSNVLSSFSSRPQQLGGDSMGQSFQSGADSASGQQQQQPSSPVFVLDLVRDDIFDLLDSFNVSIRFYRWTSFVPVWQDTVYVRNTRPQNVTRIYEQELARIIRQPGVISLSSGVFQIVVEQQPRLGLSQIENYLMPVTPNRVTAMRVARINVELIQGPFELTDVMSNPAAAAAASQWACAYRLTLVTDSIAMFVWLDLNLLNSPTSEVGDQQSSTNAQQQQPPSPQQQFDRRPPAAAAGGGSVQLDALPQASQLPPEHIRLHVNNLNNRGPQPLELYESLASETVVAVDSLQASSGAFPDARHDLETAKSGGGGESSPQAAGERREDSNIAQQQQQQTTSDGHRQLDAQTTAARRKRQAAFDAGAQPPPQAAANLLPPERLVLDINQNNGPPSSPALPIEGDHNHHQHHHSRHQHQQYAASTSQARQQQQQQQQPPPPPPPHRLKPVREQQARFKPVDASGGQLLRYQFSDNAFNMFEPSKVIDLYLSRCLSKAQVEVALEIQSLADCL